MLVSTSITAKMFNYLSYTWLGKCWPLTLSVPTSTQSSLSVVGQSDGTEGFLGVSGADDGWFPAKNLSHTLVCTWNNYISNYGPRFSTLLNMMLWYILHVPYNLHIYLPFPLVQKLTVNQHHPIFVHAPHLLRYQPTQMHYYLHKHNLAHHFGVEACVSPSKLPTTLWERIAFHFEPAHGLRIDLFRWCPLFPAFLKFQLRFCGDTLNTALFHNIHTLVRWGSTCVKLLACMIHMY